MEQKNNKRPIDWLSVGFLVMAAVSMTVSVPATFSVAALTHTSLFGAVLVVFIAEVMAFGAKLATRWFPTWHKQLDTFAIVMLSAAVLPNAAEGWNAFWRPNAAEGVWATIRGTNFYGVPVFAVLIVGVWSALPPVGVYLALTFWVRRQHELEAEQTPEAVVNRRLHPIVVELQIQRQLDEALLGLIEQRQRQFAALTGPVPPLVVTSHTEAPESDQPVVQTVAAQLDRVLDQPMPKREALRAWLHHAGVKTPEAALTFFQQNGALPSTTSLEEFKPLFAVLMKQVCTVCGKPLSRGERGAAIRYARKHNQPVRCAGCRK